MCLKVVEKVDMKFLELRKSFRDISPFFGLKVINWIFVATTKICTNDHFVWTHTPIFVMIITSSYSLGPSTCLFSFKSYNFHSFSRLINSTCEVLYTLLKIWTSITTINWHIVYHASPVLLAKIGPLRALNSVP